MTYLIISTKFQKYHLMLLGTRGKFCGEMLELEADHLLPVLRFVSEVVPPFPPYTFIVCTGMTLPSYPE